MRTPVLAALALWVVAGLPAFADDPKDPFSRVCAGDAAGTVKSLAEGYRAGTLDVWHARLYQDLRTEAGDGKALLDETLAAFKEPRGPVAQYLLARLSARKDVEALLGRIIPALTDPAPALYDLGLAALSNDKLPAAAVTLSRLKRHAPNREETTLLDARIEEAGGRREAGERLLAAYVVGHPDAAEARRAWVDALLALRRYGEASAAADEALARGRAPTFLVARAAVALGLGDPDTAKRLLEEVRDAGRPSVRAEAHALRCMLRLAARDYSGADAAADAALKVAPEDARALRAKARCLELAGKTVAAGRLLDQAIDLRPTYGALYLDKGALLLGMGKVKEAKKALLDARKRDPDLLEALLLLGAVEEEESDWVAAERAYRAVLKEDPDHVEAHRMLSGVLFSLGKLGQADDEAGWIKGRYPKDPQPWFTSGRVALRSEKFEDALAAFGKACELDPTYALGHLGRGWVLEEQGKQEDAKKAYEAAVAADPKLPLPHRDLAELLDLMDDKNGALDHFRRYLELGGDDPDEDVKHAVERLSKP